MKPQSLILGTRGSVLALTQTEHVRTLLRRAWPKMEIEVKIIKTTGDKQTTAALARSGTKGLFTKELEDALVDGKIDVAIHSLKDVPTELPQGLVLSAIPQREDPRDVLICHPGTRSEKPLVVYTSSPRRVFQAKLLWPECETREIRGNVETRLQKLAEGKVGDALLLAAAGLRRLDFIRGDVNVGVLHFDPPLAYRRLTVEEMVPAPGQGAIALESRMQDGETHEKLQSTSHSASHTAVLAERAFLRTMGGGCAAPMAAHAWIGVNGLHLAGVVARGEADCWRGEKIGRTSEAEAIGRSLAEECLK